YEAYCGSSFFFQAEDGIRDFHVTGVQTCALPICLRGARQDLAGGRRADPPRHGARRPAQVPAPSLCGAAPRQAAPAAEEGRMRTRRAFTSEWGLKLFSLALGLAIFFAVRTDQEVTTTVGLRLLLREPAGLINTHEVPA